MKINVTNFGFAAAISAACFWLLRSFFFLGMPGWGMMVDRPMMMRQTHMDGPQMMGAQWAQAGWAFSWPAAFAGLVFWAIGVGAFAALLAWIYNRLESRSPAQPE